MSCLAHLAVGPIVIASFSARLSILPWENRKTYFISCSWWILCVCKVRPLLEYHVNAILKHVCGTTIINKNIWSTMLNFPYQLSKHRCMGNIMRFLPTYLNGFLLSILSSISCSAYPWEGYTPWNVVKHSSLSVVLIETDDHFSIPLVCLNPYCDIYDISSNIPCLCKRLVVQFCQQDPIRLLMTFR